MRLKAIKKGEGNSLKHKLMRMLMNIMVDGGPPDIILTLMYRYEFFGKHFGNLLEELMRGPSDLTITQRELIAAATSEANECPFCTKMHSSTASLVGNYEKTEKLNYSMDASNLKEQVDEATQSLMEFASKLAKEDSSLNKEDIERLRNHGFSDSAIKDAIYIVSAFCLINRMANALDFTIPSEKSYRFSGKILLTKGYAI